MNKPPIYVVGAPRSGTTLLAAMLGAHSRISCGPETHFFRRLSAIDTNQICQKETWPAQAAAFVCSIRHTGYAGGSGKALIEKYQIEQEDIVEFLERKDPSIANALASVTEQYMVRAGKS